MKGIPTPETRFSINSVRVGGCTHSPAETMMKQQDYQFVYGLLLLAEAVSLEIQVQNLE